MELSTLAAPASAGAVVGLAAVYRATAFREDRASEFLADWSEYQFGRPPEVGIDSPLAYSIALAVIGGGSFGACFGVARGALRLPSLLTGTLCGIALWVSGEAVYRSQPGRQQDWSGPPRQRLPNLAAFGAAVALVTKVLEA